MVSISEDLCDDPPVESDVDVSEDFVYSEQPTTEMSWIRGGSLSSVILSALSTSSEFRTSSTLSSDFIKACSKLYTFSYSEPLPKMILEEEGENMSSFGTLQSINVDAYLKRERKTSDMLDFQGVYDTNQTDSTSISLRLPTSDLTGKEFVSFPKIPESQTETAEKKAIRSILQQSAAKPEIEESSNHQCGQRVEKQAIENQMEVPKLTDEVNSANVNAFPSGVLPCSSSQNFPRQQQVGTVDEKMLEAGFVAIMQHAAGHEAQRAQVDERFHFNLQVQPQQHNFITGSGMYRAWPQYYQLRYPSSYPCWPQRLSSTAPFASTSPHQSYSSDGLLLRLVAAEAAESRISLLELGQLIGQCKEMTLSATAKLDVASASIAAACSAAMAEQSQCGVPNEQWVVPRHFSLLSLLTDAIENVTSALLCLSPHYFHIIMEEMKRKTTTISERRPIRLAHPDEFRNSSSFLKIYGDPQCSANASHPRKGRNGNWECPKCQNINYPRRLRCNNPKCKALRDAAGDRLVYDYAREVYQMYLPQRHRLIQNCFYNDNEIM